MHLASRNRLPRAAFVRLPATRWLCAALVLTVAQSAAADLPIIEVAPGIYRGPAPETAADFRQIRCLGVETILDLRKFRRRKRENTSRCARAHGMDYVNVPMGFYPERDRSPERALRTLTSARLHPIYIHCELGRDRSGLVIGLFRVRCQGWTACQAYAEMQRLGFNERLRGLDRYFWDHHGRSGCQACVATSKVESIPIPELKLLPAG